MVSASEPGEREYPTRPFVSAHAVVCREGAVLLVKRGQPPSLGRWSAPGGIVEIGETVRDAVCREVREECGIDIEVGPILDVVDSIISDDMGKVRFHYVVIYLLAQYVGGEAHPRSDAVDVRWATPEDIGSLEMHPTVRGLLFRAFCMPSDPS
jgi:ADP-ribose pyrophosphatase YjhB (NUDIX family)